MHEKIYQEHLLEYQFQVVCTLNELIDHIRMGVQTLVVDLDDPITQQDLESVVRRIMIVQKQTPVLTEACNCIINKAGKYLKRPVANIRDDWQIHEEQK